MSPKKECAECEGAFSLVFFRRNNKASALAFGGTKPICIGCEQARRDAEKARDRWPAKIRDTIRTHARALGVSVADLASEFGWRFDKLLHDAQHAYQNGCWYCHKPFAVMGHGLADITLDIVEPQKRPFYAVNVKWCCATCNREKNRTPADEWAQKLADWDEWERQQERIKRFGRRQRKLFS